MVGVVLAEPGDPILRNVVGLLRHRPLLALGLRGLIPRASTTRPTVTARVLDKLLIEDPNRFAAGGVEPVLPSGVPTMQLADQVLECSIVVLDRRVVSRGFVLVAPLLGLDGLPQRHRLCHLVPPADKDDS